ncbi:MAG: peptidyl-prolyl cis-trans isomerase [Pyrinomonadaceae bacterium]|nr:peptidyl-prolyl cis-trans isomerase [Pyrinomonadaceae bacterium]MCX7639399.1 peptidyl-prolyl cis-trans isomerase [Pyrinomonadaceae bacterium]MDW8304551.1 peptidyl-prolyl cis-trans isomerase [Acidobacteriota bacterium]
MRSGFLLSTILLLAFSFAKAQEIETVVVDEVVAQVNEGVVTLSRVKREIKQAIDALVREGKSPEEAKREIESRQGEIIANIINDELFLQKAKELGLDSDIEAQINQRLLQIMKEQNIRSIETLREEMRRIGIDMDELRQAWRKQLSRDLVLQREVDAKVYWGFTSREIKDYYEKNKQKFIKPETVSLSEIFLSFAGKNEEVVKQKAKQLVARIRAGEDFVKVALENSERPNVQQTKGKLQTYRIDELDEKFAKPIKATKVGDVTEPIVLDEGVIILRVDERTEASKESYFDEDEVRRAMLFERAPEERKKYMASLRRDSYIKIAESYRPVVAPILFEEERKQRN